MQRYKLKDEEVFGMIITFILTIVLGVLLPFYFVWLSGVTEEEPQEKPQTQEIQNGNTP